MLKGVTPVSGPAPPERGIEALGRSVSFIDMVAYDIRGTLLRSL